jgi:hypothetical protein
VVDQPLDPDGHCSIGDAADGYYHIGVSSQDWPQPAGASSGCWARMHKDVRRAMNWMARREHSPVGRLTPWMERLGSRVPLEPVTMTAAEAMGQATVAWLCRGERPDLHGITPHAPLPVPSPP